MLILISLLLVLFGLLVFHGFIRYSGTRKLADKLSGQQLCSILSLKLPFTDFADKLWKFIHWKILKYIFSVIILSHPEDLKAVFSYKNISKGYSYKYLEIFLKGIFTIKTGKEWERKRKLINPSFHVDALTKYIETTVEHSKELVSQIQSQGNETVQTLIPLISQLSLRIICEVTVGVKLYNLGIENERRYREATAKATDIIMYRSLRPYIKDWMLKYFNLGREQERVVKDMKGFINKIIQERREYHERTGYQFLQNINNKTDLTAHTGDFADKPRRLAMLDSLLLAELEGRTNKKEVEEEAQTFIAAGFDTSSYAIVYAIMLLAENKEAQDLARAEAFEILDKGEGHLTITDLQNMKYIDRCVKETLRIFPPAPQISRHITHEIKLDRRILPVNSEAVISIFKVHRDPIFWTNPDKFSPDRFLPENIQDQHPFAYVPFGGGVRNCIGQKFATLEVKAIIAYILYNFLLEPVDATADIKFQLNMVLVPVNPLHVKFIKINKK